MASLLALSLLFVIAGPIQAGQLIFHDVSVSPGQTLVLPAPAEDQAIDLKVNPQSAEGGGFYGFSELQIWATGDLILTEVGFGCQAVSCLYSPLPFIAGKSLLATGGDDLTGAFSPSQDILTFSVSGTNGYVVISGGEYIDATGSGGEPGDAQKVTVAPLVEVPEPSLLSLLFSGAAALATLTRRRRA